LLREVIARILFLEYAMPDLTASIPHQLGRTEAKRRIQEHIGSIRQHHGSLFTELHENWNGDAMNFSATAVGQTITGRMVVEDSVLHLSVKLPWMLSLMSGTIKQKLEQQGRELLALTSHPSGAK
jgi:hypothetical protein